MTRNIVTLILLLTTGYAYGQKFSRSAVTDTVPADGFYNIPLQPEITSVCREDLSDIRLFDPKGKETPYILRGETALTQKQLFREYRIVKNKSTKKCCTDLILENKEKNNIRNISLFIKNADVYKTARLSGSDDQQNWYVIKEHYDLAGIYNDANTYEIKILNFPLSNYVYYRLEIDDSTSLPLNILKAGYYDDYTEEGKYISLPAPVITQKDSLKKSYIKITFPASYSIDKLKISIDGPTFYMRQVQICDSVPLKKGKYYFESYGVGDLSSHNEKTLWLYGRKTKTIYLVIENQDNQPLSITAAKAWQLSRYITTYLKKESVYELRAGNPKLDRPEYDLKYFTDNIPQKTPALNVKLIAGDNVKPGAKEASGLFGSQTWIWSGIILMILLLGYMSYKMVNDMKNRKEENA